MSDYQKYIRYLDLIYTKMCTDLKEYLYYLNKWKYDTLF